MFASPLKQSASGKRTVNVQEISKAEYSDLINKPSLQAGRKSAAIEGYRMPSPIPRDEFCMKQVKEVAKEIVLPEARKPLEPLTPNSYNRSRRGSTRSILETFQKPSKPEMTPVASKYAKLPSRRESIKKNVPSKSILESFGKKRPPPPIHESYYDENDAMSNRLNAINSPAKSVESIIPPKPASIHPALLTHTLLAFEVNRLHEVIYDYEVNLQNLSDDVEKLEDDKEGLLQENDGLKGEIEDLKKQLDNPKVVQAPAPPPLIKTVYVQQPAQPAPVDSINQ